MKLSVRDHALIHALQVLADMPWDAPAGDEDMVRSILRDVLPGVTRTNPALAALIARADAVLRVRGPIDGLRNDIRRDCHDWHRRRLAAAWDSIRETAA